MASSIACLAGDGATVGLGCAAGMAGLDLRIESSPGLSVAALKFLTDNEIRKSNPPRVRIKIHLQE